MDWKGWIGLTLATAISAGTVVKVHHVGQAIEPHVEHNLPPQPPRFPQAVAATGSGPLLDNVYSTASTTNYVIAGKVFIIPMWRQS